MVDVQIGLHYLFEFAGTGAQVSHAVCDNTMLFLSPSSYSTIAGRGRREDGASIVCRGSL